ncbi:MAG: hypothetical protein K2H89_03085 [Oscillospiraceae bacterium]|nr:hypothetical protein [Oscillospiraceae bacterium]
MKHTLFIPTAHETIKNIDIDLMSKYIIDDFENYWFHDTSDAAIQYFEDDKHIADMIIGTNIKYGIFLHYINAKEEKLSLYDETKLSEVVDGANCDLEVSTGLFLPKELAWEVIKEFLETGKASDKIRWISLDDIPENGNYF